MNTHTSDPGSPVPVRQGPEAFAVLKLVRHGPAPAVQAAPPVTGAGSQMQRGAGAYARPTHQPSPTESYGCVDWYSF